jgi:hypothetical protein
MQTTEQTDWRVNASCRDEDPDGLFVRGKEQRKAKMVCIACPVRTECLARVGSAGLGCVVARTSSRGTNC